MSEELTELDLDIDFSKKKKKKAKTALLNIDNTIQETETAIAYNDAMSQVLHAKAISANAYAIAMEAQAVALVADAVAQKYEETASALTEDLEILQSKKKKKKKALALIEDSLQEERLEDVDDSHPTYDQMLARLYDQMKVDRPELNTDTIPKRVRPPSVSRLGTKKTCWTNFSDYEVSLNRSSDHLQSFVFSELGITGSIDGDNQLIMKTKIMAKNIENLLRKYIEEYVRCANCKGIDTDLVKDPTTRLHFIQCKRCLANRSVAAIKSGYMATTKEDRKAARE
jgi:translation initiation factor 2 subunit 2